MSHMSAELRENFASFFAPIAELIDDDNEHDIYFVEPLEDRIGVGLSCVGIVKHLPSGRGWGLTIRWEIGRIDGMRHRCFDAKAPIDAPGNREFIDEIKRRLALRGGKALGEITNSQKIYFRASHKRALKREIAASTY